MDGLEGGGGGGGGGVGVGGREAGIPVYIHLYTNDQMMEGRCGLQEL